MSEAKVFTVAPGLSLLDLLADHLLAGSGGDPLALARTTLFLPTRRACRAMQEALLRRSAGRALLLPRLLPLGDLDAAELILEDAFESEGSAGTGVPAENGVLPPVMPALRRQVLLARQILQWHEARGGKISADQAARLAQELARLFDQLETEGIDPGALAGLVPERFAAHWEETLGFLAIVTEHWPAVQASEGCIGAAAHRRMLLQARAASWQHNPPPDPVIAAGSTGSIPATAELLAAVARLPRGMVVLPGLDLECATPIWEAICEDPSHPQFGMARLLDKLGITRAEVRPWPLSGLPPERFLRNALVAQALVPAAVGDSWRNLRGRHSREEIQAAFAGVTRIECENAGEEARVVALLLREALERPEQRAALITPDRDLAQRVAAELRRWNIDIDDSAGQPLAKGCIGRLLRLSAQVLRDDFAPVGLLALLKHPLVFAAMTPSDFRKSVSLLERLCLRGPRPAPGITGLRDALAAVGVAVKAGREKDGECGATARMQEQRIGDLLARLEDLSAPHSALAAASRLDPAALLDAHLHFCEGLAARGGAQACPGAQALWAGDEGEALHSFVTELQDSLEGVQGLAPRDYPELLETLLAGRVQRPRYGRHPRLFIWGPLEARLQPGDVLILAGLNEESWPDAGDPGPWLSRPMRASLGLPPPERQIGLAAHDFSQALAAPRVYLTRALKIEGAPSVPSRWLLRLDALLKAAGFEDLLSRGAAPWLAWARALDRPPEVAPLEAPAPRPPLEARPRKLPVTAVETWRRDPYGLYAKYVLKLRALDKIDEDPGAAQRGILIHAVLEEFSRRHPEDLPCGALDELLAIGKEAFGPLRANPGLIAFWWPRFTRIAAWFIAQEEARRRKARRVLAEVAGEMSLESSGGAFTLTATADRIEFLEDGSLAIVDYKTGQVPAPKDVAAGFAPQLPLEAAIAACGGFKGLAVGPVSELAFWRLIGGQPAGEEVKIKHDPNDLAQLALAGLKTLVAAFDIPETPYLAQPWPQKAARFNDYEHLARVREWGTGGEREE